MQMYKKKPKQFKYTLGFNVYLQPRIVAYVGFLR